MADLLVGGWLLGWQVDWTTSQIVDWPSSLLTNRLTVRMTNWADETVNQSPTQSVSILQPRETHTKRKEARTRNWQPSPNFWWRAKQRMELEKVKVPFLESPIPRRPWPSHRAWKTREEILESVEGEGSRLRAESVSLPIKGVRVCRRLKCGGFERRLRPCALSPVWTQFNSGVGICCACLAPGYLPCRLLCWFGYLAVLLHCWFGYLAGCLAVLLHCWFGYLAGCLAVMLHCWSGCLSSCFAVLLHCWLITLLIGYLVSWLPSYLVTVLACYLAGELPYWFVTWLSDYPPVLFTVLEGT